MYHDNPAINDTMLAIINDGNGDQCGYSYKQRCDLAENGLMGFRLMARKYSEYRYRHGARRLTLAEILEAADRIQAYYREHVKELG